MVNDHIQKAENKYHFKSCEAAHAWEVSSAIKMSIYYYNYKICSAFFKTCLS